ncbi:MAG: histidine kinase, partial [Elusimicrobiota bacterium]
GLAFCQIVAKRHRGRLFVESDEATGTTFRLALPGVDGAPVGGGARLERDAGADGMPENRPGGG